MDLFDAFDLRPGAVVSAVGGEGAAQLVYGLARQASEAGLAGIVVATTRLPRPDASWAGRVLEVAPDEAPRAVDESRALGVPVAVTPGAIDDERLRGFEPSVVDAIAALGPGMLAVQADGSAYKPFKAPAAHEPAIPRTSTDVMVCVGLRALGAPVDAEHVHRPEVVAELSGTEMGAEVTMETMLRVLVHDRGGRKGLPEGARLHALLHAPANDEQREAGIKLAGRLIFGGYYRAIVADLDKGELINLAC